MGWICKKQMDPCSPRDGLVWTLWYAAQIPLQNWAVIPPSCQEAFPMNHHWSKGADSLKITPPSQGQPASYNCSICGTKVLAPCWIQDISKGSSQCQSFPGIQLRPLLQLYCSLISFVQSCFPHSLTAIVTESPPNKTHAHKSLYQSHFPGEPILWQIWNLRVLSIA